MTENSIIDCISQWLRDGSQNTAAGLIKQCKINLEYVNTFFELAGDRSYDLFDIEVAAPRTVHLSIEKDGSLSEQIEVAIQRCTEANSFRVRDIHWIPWVTTSTRQKDQELDSMLSSYNAEHVTRFWRKALARKANDPDGAITAARSMLESVCKHILAAEDEDFDSSDSLPNLFHSTLSIVKLAPKQHTENALRKVMGNCQSIVSQLAAIRNDIGDAHGKSIDEIVADSIQAEFAVNLAASVAILLLSQYKNQQQQAQTQNS